MAEERQESGRKGVGVVVVLALSPPVENIMGSLMDILIVAFNARRRREEGKGEKEKCIPSRGSP
jgi:hypothetical protein